MPLRVTVWAAAFLGIVILAIGFKVGGWFVTTVTVKLCSTILLLFPPSLTVTVIIAVPSPEDFGLKVNVPVVAGLV